MVNLANISFFLYNLMLVPSIVRIGLIFHKVAIQMASQNWITSSKKMARIFKDILVEFGKIFSGYNNTIVLNETFELLCPFNVPRKEQKRKSE